MSGLVTFTSLVEVLLTQSKGTCLVWALAFGKKKTSSACWIQYCKNSLAVSVCHFFLHKRGNWNHHTWFCWLKPRLWECAVRYWYFWSEDKIFMPKNFKYSIFLPTVKFGILLKRKNSRICTYKPPCSKMQTYTVNVMWVVIDVNSYHFELFA